MMTDIIGSGRRAALRTVDGFAQGLVAPALLGELYVVLTNVFARAWLHHSFLWADEVASGSRRLRSSAARAPWRCWLPSRTGQNRTKAPD
jgi:hypothetical protein